MEVPHITFDTTAAVSTTPHPKADAEALRLERYSRAEEALVESFRRCENGPTSSQLQIESLQKVASILNARAVDAREGVEKLRGLLSDREVEPEQYESMQRQRWMEERRRVAAEELSKVLQQHLSSLPTGAAQARSQPAGSSNVRLNTNFVKFLETSRHRASLRSRTRRRAPRKESTPEKHDCPRVHHHKHLLPLRLNVQRAQCRRTFDPIPNASWGSQGSTSSADTSLDSILPPSTPATSPSLLQSPRASIKSQCLGPPQQLASVSRVNIDSNGTAVIWRDKLRSREEIIAGLVVDMPDYVGDLLAGLDTTPATGALQSISKALPAPPSSSVQNLRTTFTADLSRPEKTHETTVPPPPPRLHKSPSKKRISALLSLPEALSSRIRVGDSGNRSTWRLSTGPPPSAFPSSLGRSTGASMSTDTMLEPPHVRPLAASFSGRPSVSEVHLAPETADAEPQAQNDGKIFSRIRHRISFLRKN